LAVLWTDETRTRPKSVSIGGEATIWKTESGISIGTPLTAIERLNKRPVSLAGFGWDYNGTILHSNGGFLKELGSETKVGLQGRTLVVRVMPDSEQIESNKAAYGLVAGDRDFSSDHPSMKKLNPKVYQIVVDLN
jgi:hypothetical protein